MVGLVKSATGKMQKAVTTAAAAVTSKMSKDTIDDVARLEGDGVMKSDATTSVAKSKSSKKSARGSYKAPLSGDASTIATNELVPVGGVPSYKEDGMGAKSGVEEASSEESAVKIEIPYNASTSSKKGKSLA